jgi:hypothetical protein
MRWLAELDLLMAVDGYPSIADLRALRALNACDVSYWQILLQKSSIIAARLPPRSLRNGSHNPLFAER